MNRRNLSDAPAYFRAQTERSAPIGVDREAGVIRGFAVITKGEALGHGLWVDEHFLKQVVKASSGRGIKVRFTHPGMSSDGMGKALGRARNFYVQGDQVRADMHLLASADKSPDGKLREYVFSLAEEDPDAFGASIVFTRDRDSEDDYMADHEDDESGFQSPDPANTNNYPHARLAKLMACDVVDEPAANPHGFFHASQEAATQATQALDYCFGLSSNAPETAFGANPERARQFVTRYLNHRGLTITESKMSEDTAPAQRDDQPAAAAPSGASLADLKAEFGERPNFVISQLEKGATIEQARAAFTQVELAEARAALEQARESLSAQQAQSQAAAEIRQTAHVGTGTTLSGPGRVEVVQDNSRILTFDNPTVARAFGDRAAFEAYQKADAAGRVDETVLARMDKALRHSRDPRVNFAMGVAGPDYGLITVRGIVGRFYKRIDEQLHGSWAQKIMWLNSESNQEVEPYKWLGMSPQLREWVGARRARGLAINEYSITNKTFESTLEFDIEDWRFDKTGQINVRFSELAVRATRHWEKLLTDLIELDSLCYDGQNMFDTDHPAADQGGSNASTYNNDVAAAQIAALNVVSASAPTRDEMVEVVIGLIQHQFTFLDGHSEPYNDGARDFVLMVPANMMGSAFGAVRDSLIDQGASNTLRSLGSPIEPLSGISVQPLVNPRLAATDELYLFRTDSMMKPFIGQEPVAPQLHFLGEGSDAAFEQNVYKAGVKAVRNCGNGQWAHAIKATLS